MPSNSPSFYPLQDLFTSDDDLSQARTAGIEQEIALLRSVLRRIRQVAVQNADSPDPLLTLDILRSTALASVVLSQLLRTRQMIKAAGPSPVERFHRLMADLREKQKTNDQPAEQP